MTPDPTDRSPRRTPADVERLLRGAYEATEHLPEENETIDRPDERPAGTARRWLTPTLVAAAAAVLVGGAVVFPGVLRGGAGDAGTAGAGTDTEKVSTPAWWTAMAIVREGPTGGPHLCVGAVAQSYPPQCSGPRIVGWDWSVVPGVQSAAGVRWGGYEVVGTYEDPTPSPSGASAAPGDQGVFTLTTTPKAERPRSSVDPRLRLTTPCKEPPGGWVTNRSTADEAALQRAASTADGLPGVGSVWVDTRGGAVGTILNVSVVGDTDTAERTLRTVWGGPLCVSPAKRSRAQLDSIFTQVRAQAPGLLGGGVSGEHVEVTVILDRNGHLQRTIDRQFGTGVVEVSSALHPYRGEARVSPHATSATR